MTYHINLVNRTRALRKNGYTLSEIATKCRISKSTASLWTSQIKLSNKGIKRIHRIQDSARTKALHTLKRRREKILNSIHKKANTTLNDINQNTSFDKVVLSIFLWTEGEKSNLGRLGFINSDPTMIQTFLTLLRRSFSIEEPKLRALVHLHEYHDEKYVTEYWSNITAIPITQFTKCYIKRNTGKRRRNNYMGSIHINYYDYKVARELASLYNIYASKLRGVG